MQQQQQQRYGRHNNSDVTAAMVTVDSLDSGSSLQKEVIRGINNSLVVQTTGMSMSN